MLAERLPRRRPAFDRILDLGLLVVPLVLAGFVGFALGKGQALFAIAVVVVVVSVLALLDISLTGWCALLLFGTVLSRAFTDFLGLSQAFNFVHYPVCVVFAIAAMIRPASSKQAEPVGRWAIAFVTVTALSMLINGTEILRGLLFITILVEPIVVVWAIARWPKDEASERRVLRLAALILIFQIPLGMWQAIVYGLWDPVVGTLTQHGAGAHVYGSFFALMVLIVGAGVVAGRLPLRTGVLAGAIGTAMMVVSGAFQVLLAMIVAIVAYLVVSRRKATTGENQGRRPSLVRFAVLGIVVVALTLTFAAPFVKTITFRVSRIVAVEEWPELDYLTTRLRNDFPRLMVGQGPGTTASRASLLLTPAMLKEGSPLKQLQLLPTAAALRFSAATRVSHGGSVESLGSTSVGIMGDLGLVGYLAVALMLFHLWRKLSASGSWFAPALKTAILMVSILTFVDNWLEYPEFTIPVAVLVGLALRSEVNDDAAHPVVDG
jgi:hypothetical protein